MVEFSLFFCLVNVLVSKYLVPGNTIEFEKIVSFLYNSIEFIQLSYAKI